MIALKGYARSSGGTLVANTGQADGDRRLNLSGSWNHRPGVHHGGPQRRLHADRSRRQFRSRYPTPTDDTRGVHPLLVGRQCLPGTSLGTLTAPASLTANAVHSYTSSGIALAKDTTYFVKMLTETGGQGDDNKIQNTASDSEDAGGADGWSIADTSFFTTRGGTSISSWSSAADTQSRMIAVKEN